MSTAAKRRIVDKRCATIERHHVADSAHHCADTPLDHLRFHKSETSRRIRELVGAVDREQRAVPLVVDRPELVKNVYGSLLDCASRVGPEWLAAAYVLANRRAEPAELDHA